MRGRAAAVSPEHGNTTSYDENPPGPCAARAKGRSAPSPDEAELDLVPNPHPDALYPCACAPEFTSLCPVTGQPDFAHLVIDYAPAATLVESKSLKLYLGSFRNHGAFTRTARCASAAISLPP